MSSSNKGEGEEGIPVFMLGRSEINGRAILPALQPRFDVVHFCTSTADARRELPVVLQGKALTDPITAIGSNVRRGASPRIPVAIFVGAGFDKADYEALRRDFGEGDGLVWVREEKSDIEGLDDPNNWVVREKVGRVPRADILIKSVSKVLNRDLVANR